MPLMRSNLLQLRREANPCAWPQVVRENAESIAFYGGEAPEFQQVKGIRRGVRQLPPADCKAVRTQPFPAGVQPAHLVLPSIIIADAVLSGEVEVVGARSRRPARLRWCSVRCR